MNIGQKLKYARERSGFSLAEVEKRTGIGISSISEFENSKREPSISQLQKLSSVYYQSLSFFLSQEPLPKEVILWREKPESNTVKKVGGQFLQLCKWYRNLERWCNKTSQPFLHQLDQELSAGDYNYPQAERLAKNTSSQFNLGEKPGQSLRWILEETYGVKIFHLPFEPTGCAACSLDKGFGAAILLNSNSSRWRRNFDLAHELFHLLTWNTFRRISSENSFPTPNEEKLAQCFASRLLMPEEPIRDIINNINKPITFADLSDIARQFDVSIEALLWRVHILYNRSEDQTKENIERCKELSSCFEKRKQDNIPQRPKRFVALAVQALVKGEISRSRFMEYMGVSRKEAIEFEKKATMENDEVEITIA